MLFGQVFKRIFLAIIFMYYSVIPLQSGHIAIIRGNIEVVKMQQKSIKNAKMRTC